MNRIEQAAHDYKIFQEGLIDKYKERLTEQQVEIVELEGTIERLQEQLDSMNESETIHKLEQEIIKLKDTNDTWEAEHYNRQIGMEDV